MRRDEIEVGMVVAVRGASWQHRARAIVLDVDNWKADSNQAVRWTALETWGVEHRQVSGRSQGVAVAREVHDRLSGQQLYWVPDVVQLREIEQPWARWEATLKAQEEAAQMRNTAKVAADDVLRQRWITDVEPVLLRATNVAPQVIHSMGMDFTNSSTTRFHQMPKGVIIDLVKHITELEKRLAP